jgi:hypothetical protein
MLEFLGLWSVGASDVDVEGMETDAEVVVTLTNPFPSPLPWLKLPMLAHDGP